ncbi:beta-mannanase man5E [Microbulbifer halophilus]|uniref:mannan endo-1,4-beta-mannosidase n=1 Tax=Microbulbifer halophilus TaxID=453963 RepID=A0ABW5EFF1_9GAMM|nr:beta-mannanase man5E [Microbulbifer halophilus]MCW8126419.1 beta-mannanase man5E [Microbulbifer halophilus]
MKHWIGIVALGLAASACDSAATDQLPQHCRVPETPGGEQRAQAFGGFEHFVTRDGYRLMDGERPLRFIGLHATELHRIEDDVASAASIIGKADHFRWPTAREQDNWIRALVYSGHTATRIYTLSVDDIALPQTVRANMPAHIVQSPDTGEIALNETAMRVFDRMVYLADQHGLRLIVPVIDHWSWWGGRRELAKMAGEAEGDSEGPGPLYDTDSDTYAAYRRIVEQLLTRKNTCTGREYREEKAIMAWETGNELRGTNRAFLAETAALFKRLAPQQLLIDGDQQADDSHSPDVANVETGEFLGLLDPNVDIQSNHFYGSYMSPDVVRRQAALAEEFNKPLFIGEYGLESVADIRAVTEALAAEPAVAGGLVWGFRGRREAGGFYWHKEFNGHMSYHLPGFPANRGNREESVIDLVRETQAQISNDKRARTFATRWPRPEAPLLHPVGDNGEINWMGAPTGQRYRLYRSQDGGENWALLEDKLTDGRNGWNPAEMNLYREESVPEEGCYRYRLVAVNESGESPPSNIQSYCRN